VVSESGPDHEKTFIAAARVAGEDYGTGSGRSKKEAEQKAAQNAWHSIREKHGLTDPGGSEAAAPEQTATTPAEGA